MVAFTNGVLRENPRGRETENGIRKIVGAGFMMEMQFGVVHWLRLEDNKDGKNQAIDLFPFFFTSPRPSPEGEGAVKDTSSLLFQETG